GLPTRPTSRPTTPPTTRNARTTHASSDSPASTNPASTDREPSGQPAPRASSTRSPLTPTSSCTRQITAGSVRGYSSRPHPVQREAQPTLMTFVGAPHRTQCLARRYQLRSASAVVNSPAPVSSSSSPNSRSPTHRSPSATMCVTGTPNRPGTSIVSPSGSGTSNTAQ